MEFVLITVVLSLLGLLANRYGYDSRVRSQSPEERAAAHGMRWGAVNEATTEDQLPATDRWRAWLTRLVPRRAGGPGLTAYPEDAVWAPLQNYPYGPPTR